MGHSSARAVPLTSAGGGAGAATEASGRETGAGLGVTVSFGGRPAFVLVPIVSVAVVCEDGKMR